MRKRHLVFFFGDARWAFPDIETVGEIVFSPSENSVRGDVSVGGRNIYFLKLETASALENLAESDSIDVRLGSDSTAVSVVSLDDTDVRNAMSALSECLEVFAPQ